MAKEKYTRRRFLRDDSVAGMGAMVGMSIAPALFARDPRLVEPVEDMSHDRNVSENPGLKQAISGSTYYIDPVTGDDANDGLTLLHPLKNYANHEFTSGDTVLFKRGSIIRDVLLARSGSETAPITYAAYGEGDNPTFLGSAPAGDPDRWIEERPSLWRYSWTFASEVCNLIFNGGESCGNLRWRIEDLKLPGEWYYTGIGKSSAGKFKDEQSFREDVLYLCSPINPGRAYTSIECALWGQRRMAGGQHHIVLENLTFRNSGVHGYTDVHTRSIVIRNCEFRFIGGAVWDLKHHVRFGNAVELWDGATDVTVEGCLFDNIYDSAVTHQGGGTRNIPERIHFQNNLFVDCGLSAYESREPGREVYFEYNTCINSGGGFSMQGEKPPRRSDPYPQDIGYHVFIFLIEPGTQPGPIYIRHNIFCEGYGAAISAILDPVDVPKFVIDNNCYWQTTGEYLIQHSRLIEGKTWNDALGSMASDGDLLLRKGCRVFRPSEFSSYQTEYGQDKNSRIAFPRFIDIAGGDYRQHDDSPCRGMGCQTMVRRKLNPNTFPLPAKKNEN